MTLRPLRADRFEPRSDLSVRAPAHVDREELLEELRDEAEHRLHMWPRLVTRGAMTAEDADRRRAVWQAMLDDHLFEHQPPAAIPYALDWDARIRELRAEIAIRRAAWPRWIKSPTHELNTIVARRRMERIDALYWRYWVCLFRFTPPTVEPATDLQRIAWIADSEHERMLPAWREALAADRSDDDDSDTRRAALAARHAEERWRCIADLARYRAEGLDWADIMSADDREQLARFARARLLTASEEVDAGTLPEPVFAQLVDVSRWLNRWIRHSPPGKQERKAA